MQDPKWQIHGYAIVCEDGCIADASGALPRALMNDADWAYFQAELDRADITILGRTSHEATPNLKRRRRVVMTRAAAGLDQAEELVLFWNPEIVPIDAMLMRLLPEGGRVAIPGGSAPFGLFLPRFDGFHLSRKAGIRLSGGTQLFPTAAPTPEAALSLAGMTPGEVQDIDPEDGVTLTVWTR
ncbi:hypothetical protein ACQ5SO_01090 [Rhodovulum sp. DZ06]|uniref:hypothetical protein n=1 Tax=Rhodovulum sp. DZ06 TaxID=3425126 RepID=UPI003D3383B0